MLLRHERDIESAIPLSSPEIKSMLKVNSDNAIYQRTIMRLEDCFINNKLRWPRVAAGIMALHNVRDPDNFAHIHRVCNHMSNSAILWHRSHSKNANSSDADAAKVQPICKACAYGEQRQTGTDSNRVHRPLPAVPGQSFSIDASSCTHRSIRGFKYCDLIGAGAV